jgi:hypothetical protein
MQLEKEMTMSRFKFVWIVIPAMISCLAFGEMLETSALEKRAVSAAGSEDTPVIHTRAIKFIREVYGVSISTDEHPDLRNTPVEQMRHPFQIRRNEKLGDVLSRVTKDLPYHITEARSVLVMHPQDAETSLDNLISVKMSNVSPMEALCAIAAAVNNAPSATRQVDVDDLSLVLVYEPDARLYEQAQLTLAMNGVTAREALCELVAQIPFPCAFHKSVLEDHDVLSLFSWPTHDGTGKLDSDGLAFWTERINELREKYKLSAGKITN